MQILTIDIGTGTQDIYLYDSRLDLENGFKLILPSPTMMVRRRLQAATRRGEAVLLHGVMMGGGPAAWAAEDHARAGMPIYATPAAARTLNDDLAAVAAAGVRVVSEDEAARLSGVTRIELRDFDFPAIARAFGEFGVSLSGLDAVAVAVFDHGDAPPHVSDRQFRFDYLDDRIRQVNRLSAFAHRSGEIPPILTRLLAVEASAAEVDAPLVVMDTAPAAVLGACFDPAVAARPRKLIANVGNFHTLAFRLGAAGIEGVFEHHTGLVDRPKLEALLRALADGSLQHADVFDDHGHGALIYADEAYPLGEGDFDVAVTGPRRKMLRAMDDGGRMTDDRRQPTAEEGLLRYYHPAPFGDMMIAGCFGLLAATADVLPELGETIRASLRGELGGAAPWDAV